MEEQNERYDINALFAGFFSGEINSEEREYLLKWIKSEPDNEKTFFQMHQVWLQTGQLKEFDFQKVNRAFAQVEKKILAPSVIDKKRIVNKAMKPVIPRKLLQYAAAACLLIASGCTIMWFFMSRYFENYTHEMTYEAHYGSRAFTILPDGSKVWLNSGSKLNVLPHFNLNTREVQLTGEAYFEVKTDPDRPFTVNAGEIAIKATGTIFNVKAYPDEDRITTTLVEGVVHIEGRDEQEKEFSLKMTPNQSISYYTDRSSLEYAAGAPDTLSNNQPVSQISEKSRSVIPATVRQVRPEVLTSWIRDRWIIDNEDLGSLALKMERRYNVTIRFESEELEKYHFTGIIERETIEQIFDAFRYSIPLQYTISQGNVTLTTDECLKKKYEQALRK